jgi:hypothetical protein
MCCVEAFPGLGVQGVEGLILVRALFLLDGEGEEKERKERKEKQQQQNIPIGKEGFPRAGQTLLARGSQSYPGVAPTSQGGFGVMEVRLSASVP